MYSVLREESIPEKVPDFLDLEVPEIRNMFGPLGKLFKRLRQTKTSRRVKVSKTYCCTTLVKQLPRNGDVMGSNPALLSLYLHSNVSFS